VLQDEEAPALLLSAKTDCGISDGSGQLGRDLNRACPEFKSRALMLHEPAPSESVNCMPYTYSVQ
jgi:hypothetical protein